MTRKIKKHSKKQKKRSVQRHRQQDDSQNTQIDLPVQNHMLGSEDIFGALTVFIAVFTVYVITLSPTVTSSDSGELIAAAYDLGVAHPPGYPLWTLIAHLFIKALSFGSVAYRANLMSAFFGAATCSVMFLVMLQLSIPFIASLTAALCLGFSRELWAQSVIIEVYTLNSFLTAVLLAVLIQWHKTRQDRLVLILAFVFGLALTNHQSIALLGPVGGIFILITGPKLLKNWRLIIFAIIAFLLGLSVYLYLPWAARRNCYMNWGDPKTLKSLFEHIMRSQYPSDLTKIPRTALNVLGQIGANVKFLLDQFTPFCAVFLPVGIIAAWRNSRARCLLLLAVFFVFETACMFIINFRMTRQDLFSITVFYIPAYMFCSVFLGFAFAEIGKLLVIFANRIRLGENANKCFIIAALIPVLLTGYANFSQNDMSNCYYAYDHGKNILDTMEYDSVIFPSGDHNTFPLIYLIHVEKYRSDITLADKYGYVEYELLKDVDSPPLDPAGHISKHWAENWIIKNMGREVYFTVKRSMENLTQYHLEPCGLLYKVVRNNEPAELQNPWNQYYYRNDLYNPDVADYGNANIVADFHYMKGLFLLKTGQNVPALNEFAITKNTGHAIKELYNNIGSALAEHDLVEEAIDYYKRALIYDRKYKGALWNLAKIHKSHGDVGAAINYFERAREADEKDFRVHGELGFLYLQVGDISSATTSFRHSLGLYPNQPQIKKQLSNMSMQNMFPDNVLLQNPVPLLPQIPDAALLQSY